MARCILPRVAFAFATLLSGGVAHAQADAVAEAPFDGPIAVALEGSGESVRAYNDHVVILASPFMEGRVPGSRGMEIASEYMEHHLRRAGLEPPFDDGQEGQSYRQPFELASTPKVHAQHIGSAGGGSRFVADEDFRALGVGDGGEAKGELFFVGYSIEDGPDGYDSFGEIEDLSGKIALVLRFEPMDGDGKSKWVRGRRPWSAEAGFVRKFRALEKRNPAAVILVNPPGAADPRADRLLPVTGGGRKMFDVPLVMMGHEAADRLLADVDPNGLGLMELRELADELGAAFALGGEVEVSVDMEHTPTIAENVGGLLPGRGDLADELIVVGAHLDHLGMGNFGSRSGPGALHPGADDNASGSAAVIMLAERMAADYAALPEGVPTRSVLFLAFSGEESGLNGSRHYVADPIVPMEEHALMINFDMIGRITNKRLSVSGTGSAEGFSDWLAPMFEASELEIVQPANMSGRSDHSPFYDKQVPVLFGIIADFHDDYHTPRDVSWKINRVDAVETIDLFHEIGMAASTRPERFSYTAVGGSDSSTEAVARSAPTASVEVPDVGALKVRFGITPAQEQGGSGVLIGDVAAGTSASEAGIQVGDRLTLWNGQQITDVLAWLDMLGKHMPEDVVQVGVMRDTELLTLWVTLKAREG